MKNKTPTKQASQDEFSDTKSDKKSDGMFKSLWTKKSPPKKELAQSNSEPKIEINTLIESNILSKFK